MIPPPDRLILTIGHSNHPVEHFVALVEMHGVTAVADVRSTPYSRFHPEFNRESIERTLKNRGIDYVFLGRELGARSSDPSCYQNGRVQYRRLAGTALFKSGLDRLVKGADSHRIALMCAEGEPLACHRTVLISRELDTVGVPVSHIRTNGTLERHADAMVRLLAKFKLPEADLFRTRQDLIEDALARQEQRIAYIDEDGSALGDGGI